jgi:serine protease SohB
LSLALTRGGVEVVLVLESPGGSASDYGLAAAQLVRLRDAGVPLTVCVDRVAASGGYLMACAATPGRLLAAPWAVVGSVGVVSQSWEVRLDRPGSCYEPDLRSSHVLLLKSRSRSI